MSKKGRRNTSVRELQKDVGEDVGRAVQEGEPPPTWPPIRNPQVVGLSPADRRRIVAFRRNLEVYPTVVDALPTEEMAKYLPLEIWSSKIRRVTRRPKRKRADSASIADDDASDQKSDEEIDDLDDEPDDYIRDHYASADEDDGGPIGGGPDDPYF